MAENIFEAEGTTSQAVEQKLAEILRSPGGIDKIAQQMLYPLKRDLLYEGRIRQIFQTYKLALGEEAVNYQLPPLLVTARKIVCYIGGTLTPSYCY
jgi:hypothetical protein